jgi:uncharacterized protein YifN (PemK superfamily)
MVFACDYSGNVAPEIIKVRPVVVISPNHLLRPGLVTVVPLSTTPPSPIQQYHYRLVGNPIPGDPATEIWAKCDLVSSVGIGRLDRIKIARGNYVTGSVSMDQVREIRRCAARSIGIEFSEDGAYLVGDPRSSGQ